MITPTTLYKKITLLLCLVFFIQAIAGCTIEEVREDPSFSISSSDESSAETHSDTENSNSSTEVESEDSSLPEKENICTDNCAKNIAPDADITPGAENLVDRDPKTSVTLSTSGKGTVITLSWNTPVTVDRVVINETGENIQKFTISVTDSQGTIFNSYTQDECGESRVAAIAQKDVIQLDFCFFASDSIQITLNEIEVYSEKNIDSDNFVTSAYLPTNTQFNASALKTALNTLDNVTLISCAYWDESGKINLTDSFEEHYNKLQPFTMQNGGKLELYATIYPAYRMTKAGTAGETINTKDKRAALIAEIIAFAEKYSLAGIDFDWEFPKNEEEWNYFSLLITELKDSSNGKLNISAAFYPGKAELSREAFSALDRVNIMAYDQFDENGYHSTYKTACTAPESYDYFIQKGCTASKLFIGIPCYGRPFDASNIWNLYNETVIPDAYTNILNGSYYNSRTLAVDKAAFALQQGYGGVFLYHLKCDKPMENELSLLKGITDYLAF